jgi:ABC-type multidrug transport system fused ATPase/permease subunit
MNLTTVSEIRVVLEKISSLLSGRDKTKILLSGILLIVSSSLEVITLASIYPFMNFALNPNGSDATSVREFFRNYGVTSIPISHIMQLSIAYIFLVLFSTSSKIWILRFTNLAIANSSNNLASELFKLSIFGSNAQKSSAEVVSNLTLRCNYAMGALINITSMLASLVLILGVVYTLIQINVSVSLIGSLFLAVSFLIISRINTARNIKNGLVIDQNSVAQISLSKASVHNAKNIIIENRIDNEAKRFKEIDLGIRLARVSNNLIVTIPRTVIEASILCGIVTLILVLSTSKTDLAQVIPTIGVFAISFQKLIPSFNSIYTNYGHLLQSLESISKLAEQIVDYTNKNKDEVGRVEFKEITLNKVYHTIQALSKSMYAPVSTRVLAGDKCLIRGPSGIGKSTLMESMIGLTKPDSGLILMNYKPLSGRHLRRWWNSIAYIPQTPSIFNDTLSYNLTQCQNPRDVENYRLEKILETVGLQGELDLTMESIIEEDGGNLSGGEKQRIVLARALYMKREVLFLDEAMGAVDAKLRHRILKALFKEYKYLTVFYISHNDEDSNFFNMEITLERHQ